jgi:hypothetical protein
MKPITVLFAEGHDFEPVARPLRAPFAASPHQELADGNLPGVWFNFARRMLGSKARPAPTGKGGLPRFGVRRNQL